MKLWLIRPIQPWLNQWDTARGFIACADSEEGARTYVVLSKQYGDEGGAVWADSSKTKVNEIGLAIPGLTPGVVMRDFCAA